MKNIYFCTVVLLLALSLCGCNKIIERDDNKTTLSNAQNSAGINSNEKLNKKETLIKTLLDNIDSWESVSDDYTKNYTYDEIYISQIEIYTKGTAGEYYLSAGYIINTSRNLAEPYYSHFYLKENVFKLLYNSQTPLITVDNMFNTDYVLLGLQTFSATTNKEECVRTLITQCLKKEESYYNELNYFNDNEIVLTKEELNLFANINKALKKLEYYEFKNGNYTTQMPLTKIQFYVLENGSCEALLWYNFSREKGYYIHENGHEELSDSKTNKLMNTSKMISLEWNVKWTSEKKESMLKKAIADN